MVGICRPGHEPAEHSTIGLTYSKGECWHLSCAYFSHPSSRMGKNTRKNLAGISPLNKSKHIRILGGFTAASILQRQTRPLTDGEVTPGLLVQGTLPGPTVQDRPLHPQVSDSCPAKAGLVAVFCTVTALLPRIPPPRPFQAEGYPRPLQAEG